MSNYLNDSEIRVFLGMNLFLLLLTGVSYYLLDLTSEPEWAWFLLIPGMMFVFLFTAPITIATSLVVLVGIMKVKNKLSVSYLLWSATLVCISVVTAISLLRNVYL